MKLADALSPTFAPQVGNKNTLSFTAGQQNTPEAYSTPSVNCRS